LPQDLLKEHFLCSLLEDKTI